MSTDRDATRIVRSWLEEGVTALPDRVLDAVLDQVPATPQRRSWWPARRFAAMNTYAKFAIAAAVVVVVALAGLRFLAPAPIGPGGSPAPTVAATPPPLPLEGAISPGRYAWEWPGGRVTFAVPAGWFSKGRGESIGKLEGTVNELNWGYSFPGTTWEVTHVYSDACRSEDALAPVGPTLEELAVALANQAASEASSSDLTVGGYPAKRIEITIPAAQPTADCRYPGALFQIWADIGETGFYALTAGGWTGVVHAIDVDGQRLVFQAMLGPEVSATDVAELEAIIASIAIEK